MTDAVAASAGKVSVAPEPMQWDSRARRTIMIYLPLGCVHRLDNPGRIPLTLIEVQSGSYLGEDDIVRLEDTYGRS